MGGGAFVNVGAIVREWVGWWMVAVDAGSMHTRHNTFAYEHRPFPRIAPEHLRQDDGIEEISGVRPLRRGGS